MEWYVIAIADILCDNLRVDRVWDADFGRFVVTACGQAFDLSKDISVGKIEKPIALGTIYS